MSAKEEREAQNRIVREQEDNILFSAWLQDLHREDLKCFDRGDFTRSDLFQALQKKLDLTEIAAQKINGYDLPSLAALLGQYNETLYGVVVYKRLKQKAFHLIQMIGPKTDLEALQSRVNDICNAAVNRTERIKAADNLSEKLFEELQSRLNNEVLPWGISGLDTATGGIRRKELTAIAARPGGGKSAFALRIADKCQRWGKKVLFFPLEMSTTENLGRLCIMNGLINEKDLKSGRLTKEQEEQIKGFLDDIEARGKIKIFEGTRDLNVIEEKIREQQPYLVIIDQLTQLQDSRMQFESLVLQYSHMTRNLKSIAMKHNVAILLLCQVGRNGTNEPTAADLKWSGSIEEDSDNVIILHRVPKNSADNYPALKGEEQLMRIKLEKQRSGNIGIIDAVFIPSKLDFKQLIS